MPNENLADLARVEARLGESHRAKSGPAVDRWCDVHSDEIFLAETPLAPALACSDRRITRVLRHVMQDLTRRATCASAARVAGLERAYFSKLFRGVMNVTFTEWNAAVRVAEAKRLLHALDLSITAVGASVGYDDVTTFERVFKRLEGVCPREHRRRIARRAAQRTPNAESATPNAETPHASRN